MPESPKRCFESSPLVRRTSGLSGKISGERIESDVLKIALRLGLGKAGSDEAVQGLEDCLLVAAIPFRHSL